jgi:hypothetical protein
MLFAGPEYIRQEREKLSKWFDQCWSAIPRHGEVVKAILGETDDDTLAKAAPTEALKAREAVKALEAEHGVSSGYLAMGAEMANVLTEYVAKSRELDKLEKRSSRFTGGEWQLPAHGGEICGRPMATRRESGPSPADPAEVALRRRTDLN